MDVLVTKASELADVDEVGKFLPPSPPVLSSIPTSFEPRVVEVNSEFQKKFQCCLPFLSKFWGSQKDE